MRHQFQTENCLPDQGTGTECSTCQPKHGNGLTAIRRLVTALEAQGIQVGRYRVRHLMRQAALKPVGKRKFIHTTDSKLNLPITANILDRQFKSHTLNIGQSTALRL